MLLLGINRGFKTGRKSVLGYCVFSGFNQYHWFYDYLHLNL